MAVQLTAFETYTAPDDAAKQIITTSDRFERLIRFLEDRPWIVVDYETSGTAWYKHAQAVGIGLGSWDDQGKFWSAYVPFRHRTQEQQLDIRVIGPGIQKILANNSLKIAHNIKFEDHMSRREGWTLEGPRYDTMITAHIHDENRYLDLESRAADDLRLGDEAYVGKRLINNYAKQLAKQNKMGFKKYLWKHGYSEVPIQLCGYYCCIDLSHTGNLYKFYETTPCISQNFPRIHATEMALTEVLTDTEQTGLPLNLGYLEKLHETSGSEMRRIEHEFKDALHGHTFNMGSDPQLRDFMLNVLQPPLTKETKSGALSVDGDVLESFLPQFPLLQYILDWRDQQKTNTTYSANLIALCDAYGYLHGDLQQVGTNTGRLSCRDPNYQNMPSGPLVRQAFLVRGKGWVRLFLDYSQIELRVLAFYSGDPTMRQVYLDNGDIHKATQVGVAEMMGYPEPIPRRLAKIINFGMSYCMTEYGLAHQGKIPEEQGKALLAAFFQKFQRIEQFRMEMWTHARQNGGSWYNLFGRRRTIPYININNVPDILYGRHLDYRMKGRVVRRCERQMIASGIQGTAAELTKESMVRISRFLKANNLPALISNTVHDEIQIDMPKECLPYVLHHCQALMEYYPEFAPIPITVGAEVTDTDWGHKLSLVDRVEEEGQITLSDFMARPQPELVAA